MRPGFLAATLALSLVACHRGGDAQNGGSTFAPPPPPSGLDYPDHSRREVVGVPMTPSTPSYLGTVDSWSIDPNLPPGLALDPSTGALHGTPTVATAEITYWVTATGPGGIGQLPLVLRVHDAPRFAFTTGHQDTAFSAYGIGVFEGGLGFGPIQDHGAVETGPEEIVFHPSNQFAFVPNRGDTNTPASVSSYAIDSDSGRLSHISEVACGKGPRRLALSPDGRTAYVITHEDNRLYSYRVDTTDGSLTYLTDHLTNTGPTDLTVDALGRFVYVIHDQSADVTVFAVNPATGATGPRTRAINYWGKVPTDIVVNHKGTIAYISFAGKNSLLAYSVDPGDGSLVSYAQIPLPGDPRSVAISPYDDYLYVVCEQEDTLVVLQLDDQTGIPDQTSSIPTEDAPIHVALDESGLFAFVLNSGSHTISPYSIDPTSGALTGAKSIRTRSNASTVSVYAGDGPALPRAEFIYVLSVQSETLSGFRFDPSSGQATLAGVESLPGANPDAMVVDPLGRFVFVANKLSEEVAVFQITAASGVLLENLTRTALSEPPSDIAVDAGGRYLFVTLPGSNSVHAYSIHPATGALTWVDSAPSGPGPSSVETDPTGRFLYVANTGGPSETLSAYRFEQGQFLAGPVDLAAPGSPGPPRFSPNGSRLFVAFQGASLVAPYDVDPVTGQLTLDALDAATIPSLPHVFEPHINGQFGFAAVPGANGTNGHVAEVSISATGKLVMTGTTASGQAPHDLRVDPAGTHLMVVNELSGDLDIFQVDANTGSLSWVGTNVVGTGPRAIGYTRRW